MPFAMQGSVSLPADQATVWEKLNDPNVLRVSIPGCQSLDKSGEASFSAVVKVRIGPVNATFNGAVDLSEFDPPNSYRITGAGNAGLTGTARGGAKVCLTPTEGGCNLSYDVEASIGGKIAQLGTRMIDSVAKKLADQFFDNFSKVLAGSLSAETGELRDLRTL